MIKKKSHNTFISHNQITQSKREIQLQIKDQELKKNATFDCTDNLWVVTRKLQKGGDNENEERRKEGRFSRVDLFFL